MIYEANRIYVLILPIFEIKWIRLEIICVYFAVLSTKSIHHCGVVHALKKTARNSFKWVNLSKHIFLKAVYIVNISSTRKPFIVFINVSIWIYYETLIYFLTLKGCSEQTLASNLTLVKEKEIEDILAGNEDKYKAVIVSNEPSFSKV